MRFNTVQISETHPLMVQQINSLNAKPGITYLISCTGHTLNNVYASWNQDAKVLTITCRDGDDSDNDFDIATISLVPDSVEDLRILEHNRIMRFLIQYRHGDSPQLVIAFLR